MKHYLLILILTTSAVSAQPDIKQQLLSLQTEVNSINLRQERFNDMHNAGAFAVATGMAIYSINYISKHPDPAVSVLSALIATIGAGVIVYAPNELNRRRIYFFKRKRPY